MVTTGIFFIVFGFIIIVIQSLFPDLVPNAINNILSRDLSNFARLEFILEALLFFYRYSGTACIIIGPILFFIGLRNR
jgi:hypothetical protein